MTKQLEDYLNEVAQTLGSLPKARRADEMREIRAHLLNAFAVNQEAGQLEEEATRDAVEHFGAAQTVGAGIVTAWRRERRLDVLKVCGVAAVAAVLPWCFIFALCGALSLVLELLMRIWPSTNTFLLHHRAAMIWFILRLFDLMYVLTGAILGTVIPKQAVRGVCIGLALYACCWMTWAGQWPLLFTTPLRYIDINTSLALPAVLGAWLVSRRRLGRQARTSASVS